MPTMQVHVRRFSVVSSRPFEEVVSRLSATIGQPDMNAFHSAVAAATTVADLEAVVHGAVGSSDLIEFARFDAGEVLRKGRGGQGPKILRLVVGNPLIMKEMSKTVPDAASYVPITILLDERADGVHLSYDCMASLIAPYGSEPALAVATHLDAKIQSLFETGVHLPNPSRGRIAWGVRITERSKASPIRWSNRLDSASVVSSALRRDRAQLTNGFITDT